MPKCKHCKTKFEVKFFLQKFCLSTDECRSAAAKFAIEYSKTVQKAKDNREWQREKKVRKEAIMSHKDWLNILQKVFNTYIRTRDKGQPCISCSNTTPSDAGHYKSRGANPELAFNEFNTNLQCRKCNGYWGGNIIEYRKGLIKKYGIEIVEWLEGPHPPNKLSIPEIQEKIKEYKEKTKTLI